MLDFMEKVVFGDPVTDFLNDYGFHRGNMIGGRFTGKVIRQILSARKLDILSEYGEQPKIWNLSFKWPQKYCLYHK